MFVPYDMVSIAVPAQLINELAALIAVFPANCPTSAAPLTAASLAPSASALDTASSAAFATAFVLISKSVFVVFNFVCCSLYKFFNVVSDSNVAISESTLLYSSEPADHQSG